MTTAARCLCSACQKTGLVRLFVEDTGILRVLPNELHACSETSHASLVFGLSKGPGDSFRDSDESRTLGAGLELSLLTLHEDYKNHLQLYTDGSRAAVGSAGAVTLPAKAVDALFKRYHGTTSTAVELAALHTKLCMIE